MQTEKRQPRLRSLVALHLLLSLLLSAANSSCIHFGSDSSICPRDAAKCATVYMGNSRVVMPMVYCTHIMQGGEAGQGKQGVQWAGTEERAAGHCL